MNNVQFLEYISQTFRNECNFDQIKLKNISKISREELILDILLSFLEQNAFNCFDSLYNYFSLQFDKQKLLDAILKKKLTGSDVVSKVVADINFEKDKVRIVSKNQEDLLNNIKQTCNIDIEKEINEIKKNTSENETIEDKFIKLVLKKGKEAADLEFNTWDMYTQGEVTIEYYNSVIDNIDNCFELLFDYYDNQVIFQNWNKLDYKKIFHLLIFENIVSVYLIDILIRKIFNKKFLHSFTSYKQLLIYLYNQNNLNNIYFENRNKDYNEYKNLQEVIFFIFDNLNLKYDYVKKNETINNKKVVDYKLSEVLLNNQKLNKYTSEGNETLGIILLIYITKQDLIMIKELINFINLRLLLPQNVILLLYEGVKLQNIEILNLLFSKIPMDYYMYDNLIDSVIKTQNPEIIEKFILFKPTYNFNFKNIFISDPNYTLFYYALKYKNNKIIKLVFDHLDKSKLDNLYLKAAIDFQNLFAIELLLKYIVINKENLSLIIVKKNDKLLKESLQKTERKNNLNNAYYLISTSIKYNNFNALKMLFNHYNILKDTLIPKEILDALNGQHNEEISIKMLNLLLTKFKVDNLSLCFLLENAVLTKIILRKVKPNKQNIDCALKHNDKGNEEYIQVLKLLLDSTDKSEIKKLDDLNFTLILKNESDVLELFIKKFNIKFNDYNLTYALRKSDLMNDVFILVLENTDRKYFTTEYLNYLIGLGQSNNLYKYKLIFNKVKPNTKNLIAAFNSKRIAIIYLLLSYFTNSEVFPLLSTITNENVKDSLIFYYQNLEEFNKMINENNIESLEYFTIIENSYTLHPSLIDTAITKRSPEIVKFLLKKITPNIINLKNALNSKNVEIILLLIPNFTNSEVFPLIPTITDENVKDALINYYLNLENK